MNIALELAKFTAQAKKLGMDLSGDAGRFYKPKTARAWTVFLAKAQAGR